MKKSILGKLIIFVIIIILIISGIILILLRNSNDSGNNGKDIEEYDPPSEPIYTKAFNTKMQIPDYFAVKSIIEKYLLSVDDVNGNIDIDESLVQDVNETKKQFTEYGINCIKDMLDERYIKEFNVDNNYIINSCKNYNSEKNSNGEVYIEEIYASSLGVNKLLTLVKFNAKGYNTKMLVVLDINDLTFSLFLSDYIDKYKYDENMAEENMTIEGVDIVKNDNNTFGYLSASDETLAKEYMIIYKNLLLNQSDKLFNLLDEEYRAKRFENKDEYQKYISGMQSRAKSLFLSKYRVKDGKDGSKEYNLLDNYNNVYTVIRDKDDITKYKYRLDDYTIKSNEFLEEYNSSTDNEKVSTNIGEFISYINTKNYKAAYNSLNETFKNSNFGSLDKFEQTMKNSMFEYNVIDTVQSYEKNGNYHIYSLKIKDGEKPEKTKEITIIMQLLEETNFEMSFSF